MRYSIRLSYNGAAFSGWQIQPNAPSVQECLQNALSILLHGEIIVTGAGRTDTKVNAVNYMAHFETGIPVQTDALCYKLNAMLPSGIAVHEVAPAASDFHARFDASSREYKYFIHRKKDPFLAGMSFLFTLPLDIARMNEAAEFLIGTKDFSCFEKTGGNNKTSICTITEAHWDCWKPTHVEMMGYPYEEGAYIVFTVRANRFLRNMVRAIVGSMVEIGRGRHSPEWMREVIGSGSRSKAGQSVPGHALYLSAVDYRTADGSTARTENDKQS